MRIIIENFEFHRDVVMDCFVKAIATFVSARIVAKIAFLISVLVVFGLYSECVIDWL